MNNYFKHAFALVLLLCSSSVWGQYNPGNPPEPFRLYPLVLKAQPAEGGTVSGAGDYTLGSNALLKATAAEGYGFVRWINAKEVMLSTYASFYFRKADSLEVITAQFAPTYPLTLKSNPEEASTLRGEGTYLAGKSVSLSTTGKAGYRFVNWTNSRGEVVATESSFSYVTGEEAETLTANYQLTPFYTLKIQASPSSAATLYGSGTFEANTSVQLYGNSNSNFQFEKWTNSRHEEVSTAFNFYYTTEARNDTLTAHFQYVPSNPQEPTVLQPEKPKKQYALTLEASPAAGGSFNITSGTLFEEGSTVNVYAYNNSYYQFVGWEKEGIQVSTNRSYNCPIEQANVHLIARYIYNPFSPNEPEQGTTDYYGLYALTQTAVAGERLLYDFYLENTQAATELRFEASFPEGMEVDTLAVSGSSRLNGHRMEVQSLPGHAYRFTVKEGSSAFSGTNGKILTIPVKLSNDLTPNVNYRIGLSNATLKVNESILTLGTHPGTIVVKKREAEAVYAGFSYDKYHNRVLFTNLSSENAQTFLWDFKDGTTSTERNPFHCFASSGNYRVQLIASSTESKDTVIYTVAVGSENTWNLEGEWTLNYTLVGPKNCRTAEELIGVLHQMGVGGAVTVTFQGGATFDYTLTEERSQALVSIAEKYQTVHQPLTFRSSTPSTLNLLPQADRLATDGHAFLTFGKAVTFAQVQLLFDGNSIDFPLLNRTVSATVCNGDATEAINLQLLGDAFTYHWALPTAPAHLTGYQLPTGAALPSMTLVNPTSEAEEVGYTWSIALNEVVIGSYPYTLNVLPDMQTTDGGAFRTMEPLDSALLQNNRLTFRWNALKNVTAYDLYVWEQGTAQPTQPTVANLSTTSATLTLLYEKSYRWFVSARGSCQTLETAESTFRTRDLPDLLVTAVELPTTLSTAGNYTLTYQVKNSGKAASTTRRTDQIWLSATPDITAGSTLLASFVRNDTLRVGQSVTYTYHFTAPANPSTALYFLVKCDTREEILEEQEANNMATSTAVNVQEQPMEAIDYALLCQLYSRLGGAQWSRPWNISRNQINAQSWPGVTFADGRVVAIDLNANHVVGTLDSIPFCLPQLRSLNLSQNQLEANLATLVLPHTKLQKLNLSDNALTGDVYAFATQLDSLTDLDLAGNRLSEISQPLPATIATLSLGRQRLSHQSPLPLNSQGTLPLPTLLTYRHTQGDFLGHPSTLTCSSEALGRNVVTYTYNNYTGLYQLSYYPYSWQFANDRTYRGWTAASGTTFRLTVGSGTGAGSSYDLTFTYPIGDANIDTHVDLLDLQQTLNFIGEGGLSPFNFVAGNTYADGTINIQDVVATINLLLSTAPQPAPARIQGRSESSTTVSTPADVTLSMMDGTLQLSATREVAALDLFLADCKEEELLVRLNPNHFQWVIREQNGGVRMLLFSANGHRLPAGETLLGLCTGQRATLSYAMAASPQARVLTTVLRQGATAVDQPLSSQWSIEGNTLITTVSWDACRWKLTTLDGKVLYEAQHAVLPVGTHLLFPLHPAPGIYLLQLEGECQGTSVKVTHKIGISK